MSIHSEKSNLVDRFIHKYGRLPTEVDPDYLEMLRMGKYTYEEVPLLQPGKCANCGSSKNDERQYVNFGLDIDWYGIVYLCTICLKDVATDAGLFNEHTEMNLRLLERIAELEKKLDQGVELPDNLVKAWEEFKEYYASVYPNGINTDSVPISSSPSDTVIQESNETESDKLGSNSAKSRTTKSTASSGRKNVSSLADLLDSK